MAEKKYGEWAFLAGIVLALIIGLFASLLDSSVQLILMALLVLLGLVVGFLNIREKEVVTFLVATIALLAVAYSWTPILALLVAYLGTTGTAVINAINGFMGALVAFISPAAFVVALKAIYNLANP